MIKLILRQLTNNPFYPHWLEFYKREKGNDRTLRRLKGKIIEVGAGDGSMKYNLLKKYKKIDTYISTDYTSWDSEFDKRDTKARKFWGLSAEFLRIRQRMPVDRKCDALNLPFKGGLFDYHLSFEVLEHIENPNLFFIEARRVLKRGGFIILSVPFLYRVHYLDSLRYTYNFFYAIAKANKLKVIEIYSNTGFGTTFASLTNQWLIRCILKSNLVIKIILLTASPVVFFMTNIIGFLLDIKPDKDFATRFHVIMRK